MPGNSGKISDRQGLSLRGRPLFLVAAMLGALCASSCSVGGGETQEGAGAGNGIPDTVAVGLVHRVSQNGRLSIELTAARAETFNDTKQTILTDARFVEYDDKGGKATEGMAQKVVYHSDSKDADISGGVKVRSASEKGTVSADSLSWQNKERRLAAPPQEVVSLRKDDGTSLTGTGFNGDFRSRELVFTGPVNGTYVSTDKQ